MNKSRNAAVDLAKYIASIMVIAIHTSLFHDVNENVCFFVVHILCRVAVPFFAVCTGYFLTQQICQHSNQDSFRTGSLIFKRQWRKLILIYVIWSILYMFYSIPMWIEIGWFSPFAFVDYVIGAITKGSHYHLWYIWGMIYTFPVFYLIIRHVSRKWWAIIAAVLWALKATTYGYAYLLKNFSAVTVIFEKLGTFLCPLPLMLIGALIVTQPLKSLKTTLLGLGLCFIGLCIEAYALKANGQEAFSYIFFTMPLCYYLFQAILKIRMNGFPSVLGNFGKMSVFIYLLKSKSKCRYSML